MNQMAKEPFRSRAIAPCLDQDVQNLTVLINCSPQVVNPSVDPNEYLVDMPAPAYSTFVLPQPSGVLRSELAALQPDRFITDDYASRGEQFFNIPERQREPIIKPHRMGDDLRGKSVALIGGDGHRSSIGQTAGLTCQYPSNWRNRPRPSEKSLEQGRSYNRVEKKIQRHLARARQRGGFGWKRWSREWLYGTLGLFLEYRVSYPGSDSAVASL
jgi:hypothetical protein